MCFGEQEEGGGSGEEGNKNLRLRRRKSHKIVDLIDAREIEEIRQFYHLLKVIVQLKPSNLQVYVRCSISLGA
jgi:hypothetical protein